MPKTILVVDDEHVLVEISKRKLEEMGYQVLTAIDGETALEQLQRIIPDLIVLDVQMPGMNGYTFIMEKAKNPAYKNVPVVIVTSHTEMEPLFKHHGITQYLVKPLKLQQLLDKIIEIAGPAK